jgi:hypothetical protein
MAFHPTSSRRCFKIIFVIRNGKTHAGDEATDKVSNGAAQNAFAVENN